jgi:monoamine oxidase
VTYWPGSPDGTGTVAVLGAGIAGLVVAYELERLGVGTTIYEADDRIGGRIYSRRFGDAPGAPIAELGAMRIPRDHAWTMHYVRELGLATSLHPFHNILGDEHNLVRVGPRFVRVRDAAAALAPVVTRAAGPFRRPETMLFGASLLTGIDTLGPRELRVLVRADLRRVLSVVDEIDLTPFVRGHGVDLRMAMAAHRRLRETCSTRLQSFIDDLGTEFNGDLVWLDGGMSRITTTLAAAIDGPLHRRHEIRRIDVRKGGVRLAVENAGRITMRMHPAAVCTIPFSVLRTIPMSGVDQDKLTVVRELDYPAATKVALHVRRPFWQDHGIRGGGSATGGVVRQTYYPNTRIDPARDAVLLGSYAIAEDADVLGRMPVEQRHRVVLEELTAMHPELGEPGAVLEMDSIAWGEHRWTRGCAARRWNADDPQRARDARRAARAQGPLFFAGEHCSVRPAWINSAIESARAAVAEIQVRIPDLVRGDGALEAR